jgi:hypothetical protein
VKIKQPRQVDYSEKSISELEATLDRWFSQFIRLRDADEFGMIKCCTCGKRKHWKESHCGHYVKRGRQGTRFNEQNCSAQCAYCNTRRNGEEQAHRLYINHKYGEGTAEFLKDKGRKPFKMLAQEYIEKINLYKDKVKQLGDKQ